MTSNSSPEKPRPSIELRIVLAQMGLEKYYARLVDNGFDNWDTILDVQDSDLRTMKFKPKHIQILRRELSLIRIGLDTQG